MIVRGEGPYIWDINGKRYLDGLSGLFVVQAGHGRQELADAAAKQAAELAYFPLWSYAHPKRGRARRPAGRAGPRRPQPGLLHHRRLRGRRGGLEAGPLLLQARRQADQAQGDLAATSPTTAPRWARCRSPGIPAHQAGLRAAGAVGASGCRTRTSTARRPDRRPKDAEAFGRWAADRIEEAILFEGAGHRRRRLPRAGAERRRLLPAAARLLPAGPRDLRPLRRAARLGRGDLRVRPARRVLRRRSGTATSPTSSPAPRA